MTTRSDLEQLATIVEARWSKRYYCLLHCMGVLYPINDSRPGWWAARRELIRALGFSQPEDMYRWNDEDGRTKQDVLDRIRSAL